MGFLAGGDNSDVHCKGTERNDEIGKSHLKHDPGMLDVKDHLYSICVTVMVAH